MSVWAYGFDSRQPHQRGCKKTVLSEAGHPELGGLQTVQQEEEKRAQQKKTGEETGQNVENFSRKLSGKLFCP